jgi:pimeloyl-ACP methyl ester carboxylesterase
LATARHLVPDDVGGLAEKYRTITAPTLILWGRHDAVVPLSNGQRLHNAIAGSTLRIIDDCGHVPPEEMPAKTLEAITGFILSLSAPDRVTPVAQNSSNPPDNTKPI